MRIILRLIGKIIGYFTAIVIICFVAFIIWLKIVSPGTTKPFTDKNGNEIPESIAEIKYLNINGIEQFVLIRGENINNPILLMVHGGPGSPQAHMNCKYNKELEKHYVVVNWDQRGSGASYYDSINSNNMSIDIMIDDTKVLSSYLINRFHKEKIFILGHSWGSYLGMRSIQKYPELYHAYIGIGQVSNQQKSEELSYRFVLNYAIKTNNTKAIKQLEDIGFPENGIYKDMTSAMQIERKWVTNFSGAAYGLTQKDLFSFFIGPLLTFKEYRVKDKLNYFRGVVKTQKVLWVNLFNEQLIDQVIKVDIPIYILHGEYDYQTCYSLAKEYFEIIEASHKDFITFSNSAHMLPYNKEIDKFYSILINKIPNEVLINKKTLEHN